ncbi:MAG: hypothetical protein ACOCYT_05010 [Chloroflexota bacterium]
MNENSFALQERRRTIEDRIIASFNAVDFKVKKHRYLEDDTFWDYIFAWYELVKFYEDTEDTAIGQNMLQLYTECVELFKLALDDKRLHDRRKDKAHMAIYQLNYYLQLIMQYVRRNSLDQDNAVGRIGWQ